MTLLNWKLIFSTVIVMVTVCFTYPPLILRETFNLWMMKFVHLRAQIALKPMSYLNLNYMQILHLHYTRTNYSLYEMVITGFLVGKIIVTAYILIIMNITSLWLSSIWLSSLMTFQICWLLCTTLTSNVLNHWFYFFIF